MYADNLSLFFSFLSLHLCLFLRRPGLHVGHNDASTREWKSFHSLVLALRRKCKPGRRKHKHKRKHKALMLPSHQFTRRFLVLKPGLHVRRKHKHKRKERKLKNSEKLSAYNLVTRALPFSAMLESNLAPKGSPAARLRQICLLLRLRMSRYAYAYRTRKHPCACACAYFYACVVRVNQA